MTSSTSQDAVLQGQLAGSQIGDDIWILPGQGNALAARTDEGLVLIDAGNRALQPAMEKYFLTLGMEKSWEPTKDRPEPAKT